jgi:hypothetical protein
VNDASSLRQILWQPTPKKINPSAHQTPTPATATSPLQKTWKTQKQKQKSSETNTFPTTTAVSFHVCVCCVFLHLLQIHHRSFFVFIFLQLLRLPSSWEFHSDGNSSHFFLPRIDWALARRHTGRKRDRIREDEEDPTFFRNKTDAGSVCSKLRNLQFVPLQTRSGFWTPESTYLMRSVIIRPNQFVLNYGIYPFPYNTALESWNLPISPHYVP